MKMLTVTSLALIFTMCASAQAPNAPAKAPTPFEQTLMAAEKSFLDAAKKGDAAFFKRRSPTISLLWLSTASCMSART